jgi:curved DNA-binding protein CbpA
MNGPLTKNSLVELIWEIKSSYMGGALRLTCEKYKCVIYFSEGDVLFATSNVKAHRLRECLLKWNLASAAQLASIDEGLSDSDFSNRLLELELLDISTLERALARQIEEVLRPALLWAEGEWFYDPKVRLSNIAGVRFDAVSLITEAARYFPPDFAASRFANSNELLAPIAKDWQHSGLQTKEAFLLTRLSAPMRVHELLAISGLPETETLHLAFCLTILGFIERSGVAPVFPEEVVAASKTSVSDKTRLISIASSSVPGKPVPAAAPKAVPPHQQEPDTSLKDFEALFARLAEAKTHYEVMDVGRAADDKEIKRVYYSLARRFHPDLYRHHADNNLHGKVEAAFARIAQAYETLRTPNLRSAYDAKIGFQPMQAHRNPTQSTESDGRQVQTVREPSSTVKGSAQGTAKVSGAAKAEESFNRGLEAMKLENYAFAAAAFSEAVKLAPKEAKFRAYYGQALGARQQTRRQAEAEIQSAIAMDKQNPLFYIMLAELYQSISLYRRALSAAEQAISIDPRNQHARALVNRLTELSTRPVSKL